MALLFWSTWQARNVLLFCSLEELPTRVRLAWRKLFTANIPTFLVILIREIKKTSTRGISGGCAKEEKEQTQLFSYVALDTDVENKHKSGKTRLK